MADGKFPNDVLIRYERHGAELRLTLKGVVNHELREVLVGLWARLDRADQEDHIRELQHYLEPGSRLSDAAQTIARAEEEETAVNLLGLAPRPPRRRRLVEKRG